jgi:hypothetical protein
VQQLRAVVLSVKEKAASSSQVRNKETNGNKPLMNHRKQNLSASKLGFGLYPRINLKETYLLFRWCSVLRGRDLVLQAFLWNVGTSHLDVKGDSQVVKATRFRVPMQDTGAEQFVVALMSL